MTQHTFLVEIGTEELPPKMLRVLSEAFASCISATLDTTKVRHGAVSWFASPRRLAVKITALGGAQADINVEKRGPAIAQAFDAAGNPTKAAEGWARSCGITVRQAERFASDKGEWLVYRARVKGLPVQELLCVIVSRALDKLPIQKIMRWGNHESKFIRPVHTVTLLLNDRVIAGNILGIKADRVVRGHRFMGEREISLEHADQYPQVLLDRGRVMADYLQRKENIRQNVEATAKRLGGTADLNEALLEEVTSLVEWPVVLTASFEEKFLSVPAEALVCTMKCDQKYFPVYNAAGNLLPHFIFVANIESKSPWQIIAGNQKVVRSRLSDAEFFFNIDRKQRLEDRLPQLNTMLFQKQLGTLRDRSVRIEALASWIAGKIGADVPQAARAGLLSKCDLMTNMVFEFADTQGVIGMHYARHDGESETVALAQKEQYQPRFSGDVLPTTLVSCAVAIADKMDVLAGIFGIGQHPKPDKDPFALRRAALGVLRIIVEKKLATLDLQTLTEEAVRLYGEKLTNNAVINDIINFMLGRFPSWYQEQGHSVDTIQAVLARRPTRPADFDARVRAVSYFRTLEEAASLTAANKRVSNILAKADGLIHEDFQVSVLLDPLEITLANHLVVLRRKLKPLFEAGRYQDTLLALASLREPVDAFFDGVMVMADNPQVRINRLTLLVQLRKLFLQVADISLLQ
ncbi:glycine--tRNA ligase subunit beta [Candidatus Doolittlea endobia]|uniref:Glycine--tRNA ligase beta subunit n=1 Tax=Candidatus Doolittlea endobia TaxID=1778262 RepID=A0A143WUU8_9ENTR|nr:glycine--tRNA ligase subunit beta [Candidatus Doolittlea endobia]CUX96679.1 Glycine--tRNA ligase beta subunit [Candidatus Doolittlea endobia]